MEEFRCHAVGRSCAEPEDVEVKEEGDTEAAATVGSSGADLELLVPDPTSSAERYWGAYQIFTREYGKELVQLRRLAAGPEALAPAGVAAEEGGGAERIDDESLAVKESFR